MKLRSREKTIMRAVLAASHRKGEGVIFEGRGRMRVNFERLRSLNLIEYTAERIPDNTWGRGWHWRFVVRSTSAWRHLDRSELGPSLRRAEASAPVLH